MGTYSLASTPSALTAQVKGSFAYRTVKDRLPVILTKVLDHVCREKINLCEVYGWEVLEEIKEIVGQLSQLKNEMQTNKPFMEFPNTFEADVAYDDCELWNKAMQLYRETHGQDPKWFCASWLFAECYLYKRIHHIFSKGKSLSSYDPFSHQKKQACVASLNNIKFLSEFVLQIVQSSDQSAECKKKVFLEIIEMALWGNQCDLSISGGAEIPEDFSPLLRLDEMRGNIVVSHHHQLWQYLTKLPEGEKNIAFILDNAGLELVADLCLALLLSEFGLVSAVAFYPKTRPWFVSDTTSHDFFWTLDYMRDQGGLVAELSEKIKKLLDSGLWTIREDKFWTGPHDFAQMKAENSPLHEELSQYALLIFKGDLNYRKLTGDLDWPNNTRFKRSLRGFHPAPILALRTIKGGPVVGLDPRSPNVLRAKSKDDWNTSGDYGMIQFSLQPESLQLAPETVFLIVASIVFLIAAFCWKT